MVIKDDTNKAEITVELLEQISGGTQDTIPWCWTVIPDDAEIMKPLDGREEN